MAAGPFATHIDTLLTIPDRIDTIRPCISILGEISNIETFATGSGTVHMAEIHWYEAAGLGRKELKIKHLF